MKVSELLKAKKLMTKEMGIVNYHMNLFNCELDRLKKAFPEINGKTDDEVATFIVSLYDKCNSESPNYDGEIDMKATRLGLRTDNFNGRFNRNIWNNGMFHDDGFGLGTEPISIYDDYIDSQSGMMK